MSPKTSREPFVIAISGAPGSGKTTLVKSVVAALEDAVALHFDDYKSVADYPADMRTVSGLASWIKNGKDLDAWKIPQLLEDLSALRAGQTVIVPDTQEQVAAARYIILEEPSGRARAGLAELVDMVAFIDIPLEIALSRRAIEYISYCINELPDREVRDRLQKFVDMYEHYHLAREYYLTIIKAVRSDCNLILDGMRSVEELTQEVVTAINGINARFKQ